jgi:RNA polymerase sigma-70 factor, ECF subfamily
LESLQSFRPCADSPFPQTLPVDLDESALDQLFAASMPKLLRTARQILRHPQDSEDALQEGLLSAFKNLHQFQGRSKFSTWLHSIIKNSAKMHARKKGSRPFYSIETELSDENNCVLESACPDPSPDPEQTCALREQSRILATTLGGLPPRYRAVIQLFDIEGLDGREAAEALGVSLSGVKTSLHRARRLLSKKIQEGYLLENNSCPTNRQAGLRQGR